MESNWLENTNSACKVLNNISPHVQATATNAGAAASKAETSKMTKYAALSATHLFIPLAFDTLGSWREQAKSFTA